MRSTMAAAGPKRLAKDAAGSEAAAGVDPRQVLPPPPLVACLKQLAALCRTGCWGRVRRSLASILMASDAALDKSMS